MTNGAIEDGFPDFENNYVILDYYKFERNALMNDISKISDNKICFTATLDDHETIFIVILNIINSKLIKIRFYSFQIYNLLNYKFLEDMKSYVYNQFLVIGGSVCKQKECYNCHNHDHFSSLIFFSYPNSTDILFEISEYLLEHNEIKIEALEIDLKNYVKIDNNIFGHIYSGIKINNISNYDKIKLYSSEENIMIQENHILKIDEKIKDKFNNEKYLKDRIIFEYSYIVTEPDRNLYDSYATEIDEIFDSMKTQYIGKISYFTIYLKDDLDTLCSEPNCDLCLNKNISICITCKSDYYYEYYNEEQIKLKICNNSIFNSEKFSINSDTYSTNQEVKSDNFPNTETIKAIKESEILTEIKSEKEIESENSYNISIYLNCRIEDILNNLCKEKDLNNNETDEIYKELKKECLNYECASKNKIVETKNVIFQLATLKIQQNDDNQKISNIDLGECENILRKKYYMKDEDEFIIIKKEIRNNFTTYVEYEIYNSRNLEHLNLDICNENQIIIDIPVYLEKETEI